MKIVVPAVAVADFPDMAFGIEGTIRDIIDIAPLIRNFFAVEVSAGSATFNCYFDIRVDLQGVYDNVAPVAYTKIDDSYKAEYKNLQASSISMFEQGKGYLILSTLVAPTKMIPRPNNFVLGEVGASSEIFAAKRYMYLAGSTHPPINMTSVDVISFEIDAAAVRDNIALAESLKDMESMGFRLAAGGA